MCNNFFPRLNLNKIQRRNFWNLKKSEEEPCKDKEDAPPRPAQDEAYKIPDSWSQPKVVVIGAGIAGLSAAHRLVQCGLCDVTILEATDRSATFYVYLNLLLYFILNTFMKERKISLKSSSTAERHTHKSLICISKALLSTLELKICSF